MKIALSGSSGKMGLALLALIKESQSSVTAESNKKNSPWNWNPEDIEGVIDFSLPPLLRETSLWCEKYRKPLVSGTTGLLIEDFKELKRISKRIPLFYGENMSWGIWQMGRWLKSLKGTLDLELTLKDIHHKNKKDSPSGTALRLKNQIPFFLSKKMEVLSVREGEEFGTHQLELRSSGEVLTVKHQALSRKVFAEGALRALTWLKEQKNGFYVPEDLYQSKEESL